VHPAEEFEHVRWYLQHEDGHVITCQPKVWMDTGGFAMYIETVLAPWWLKEQTSWTGPDPFPAKRMLLVCDNSSVHKADELKKLMEQYGIILMFLPTNMTQWLQSLDRVVCGLIKIVHRARRGRHLQADLKQWKQEQERVVGEALLNKRPHPTLTPWLPPKPTLLQGIFFYQKTHMEELQLEKTKNAIRRFLSTPVLLHSRMEGGKSTVVNGLPTTGATLPQTKFCRTFSSCRTKNALVRICSALVSMIKILPSGVMPTCRILWFLKLTMHRTSRRRRGQEEEEKEQQRGGGGEAADLSHLVVPDTADPDYASDSEEEEGEEEEEEEHQQHQLSPPIDDTPRKRSRR
jgi:hypothetical protein